MNNFPVLPDGNEEENSENPFDLSPEEEANKDLNAYEKARAFAEWQLVPMAKTLATMYVNLLNFTEDKKAEYSHHWTHNLERDLSRAIAMHIQELVDADIEKYNKADTKEKRQELIKGLVAEISPFVEEQIQTRAKAGEEDARQGRERSKRTYDSYFSNLKVKEALLDKDWLTHDYVLVTWMEYQNIMEKNPEFNFKGIANKKEFDSYLKASSEFRVNPVLNEIADYLRNLLLDGGGNSFRLVDIFENLGVSVPEHLQIEGIDYKNNNIWLDRADVMNMFTLPLECIMCPKELRKDLVMFFTRSADTLEGRTMLHTFLVLTEITHIAIDRFINERRLGS